MSEFAAMLGAADLAEVDTIKQHLGRTTHPRRAAETRDHGLAGECVAIYAAIGKQLNAIGASSGRITQLRLVRPGSPVSNKFLGHPPEAAYADRFKSRGLIMKIEIEYCGQ